MDEDFDTWVKVAIYHHIARTTTMPSVAEIAAAMDLDEHTIRERTADCARTACCSSSRTARRSAWRRPSRAFRRSTARSLAGRCTTPTAPGTYSGVIAALGKGGVAHSECAQSKEPLRLALDGTTPPSSSSWVFHCLVPASRWWSDLVFT